MSNGHRYSKVQYVISKEELKDVLQEIIEPLVKNYFNKLQTVHEKPFLNIDEAAALLDIARQTIYQMVSKRQIPFYKRSKRLYFKKSELIDWITDSREKSFFNRG